MSPAFVAFAMASMLLASGSPDLATVSEPVTDLPPIPPGKRRKPGGGDDGAPPAAVAAWCPAPWGSSAPDTVAT